MAATSTVEVERSYELPPDAAPPGLVGVAGVMGESQLPDEDLDAVYYDTVDLRLSRSGATLRRRTGGRDAGWHLKLPLGGRSREELQLPLGRASVPAELRGLLRSRSLDRPLRPVVRLHTHRGVRQLLDADGRVLAEVADDRVTAELLVEPVGSTTWREVKVELVAGGRRLLDEVEARLGQVGAVPAASQSKLLRALDGRVPVAGRTLRRKRPTAADAVLRHLQEQVAELTFREPGARRDAPDAVHRMRVASRRLRSALRTCRPLLERAATDPVRAELAHLAAVLGAARDAEVLRDRLRASLDELPVELVLGPVAQRVTDELGRQHREAHASLVQQLDSPRHLALLVALEELLAAPPWTARARRPARAELTGLLRHGLRQLERAAAAAEAAPTPQARELALHEVRKTAKQVRYAAESTTAVLGREAADFAKRVTRVQEVLGEHQDSVIAAQRLRELGVAAHLAGENGFTFGLLLGLERARGEQAQETYPAAWREVSRPRSTRWLGRH